MSESTFQKWRLYQSLGELEERLAELRYIDKALEYIDGRDQNASAGPGPAYHRMTIHLGTTHPFTRSMGRNGIPFDEEEVNQDLATLAEQAATWSGNNMETLRGMIDPIISRSAAAHDTIAGRLDAVKVSLETRIDHDFGEIGNNLSDWDGDAAENFADRFYNPFENVLDNQLRLVAGLMAALHDSKKIVNHSQHSVQNTVESSLEVVKEQLKLRGQGDSELSMQQVLLIGVGTATLVTLTGGLWAVAATAVSAGLIYMLAGLPPEEAELAEIKAQNAQELADELTDKIQGVVTCVDRSESALYEDLSDLSAEVEAARTAERMVPRRPDLADGVSGSDFYYQDSAGYP